MNYGIQTFDLFVSHFLFLFFLALRANSKKIALMTDILQPVLV